MSSPTWDLAEYIAAAKYEDLPPNAVEIAKLAVLDHLACGTFAADQPWTAIAVNAYRGVRGPSVLYGRPGRTSAEHAALVNGTSSHGYELDDVISAALIHPGAVIVPAALAYAFEARATGRQLIGAVAWGYEVMARASYAAGRWATTHGFHTTGVFGPLGASTAVGVLMELDAAELNAAWAFAATMGSGLKAFQRGGGMTKRFHAGLAAARGVEAARYAKLGAVGPGDGLDGPSGFLEVYGQGHSTPTRLSVGLGTDRMAITDVYIKPYPTCAVTHPIIEATRVLRARAEDREVARLVVGTSERGVRENSNTQPTDLIAVQYSIEFATALAWFGYLDTFTGLTMEAASDTVVRQLARQIELRVDDEVEAAYPDKLGASVTAWLTDGTELTETVRDISAVPRLRDLSTLVRPKFNDLTAAVFNASVQRGVVDAIERLEDLSSLDALAGLLAGEAK